MVECWLMEVQRAKKIGVSGFCTGTQVSGDIAELDKCTAEKQIKYLLNASIDDPAGKQKYHLNLYNICFPFVWKVTN